MFPFIRHSQLALVSSLPRYPLRQIETNFVLVEERVRQQMGRLTKICKWTTITAAPSADLSVCISITTILVDNVDMAIVGDNSGQ